ncbi:FAR1-related sequence 6 [Actinidia rufa]|uniref:Protein FAR1-RELATED SEQUENCE n=1 Tax=Actinidia rufa TaxID=165716 RepID=A0A7J0FZD7_9ERIC|nr:FAR1-related sequence 6 [Actinidia rufa]
MMSSCLSVTQIRANGPMITYMVKEREEDGDLRGVRKFEVIYDKGGVEVRCICSCFNFKGYLCQQALCVFNYNGVEEIPSQYDLSLWRKDFKLMDVPDLGSNSIDITNPVQWFDHSYKLALQVVEEGMTFQGHGQACITLNL